MEFNDSHDLELLKDVRELTLIDLTKFRVMKVEEMFSKYNIINKEYLYYLATYDFISASREYIYFKDNNLSDAFYLTKVSINTYIINKVPYSYPLLNIEQDEHIIKRPCNVLFNEYVLTFLYSNGKGFRQRKYKYGNLTFIKQFKNFKARDNLITLQPYAKIMVRHKEHGFKVFTNNLSHNNEPEGCLIKVSENQISETQTRNIRDYIYSII